MFRPPTEGPTPAARDREEEAEVARILALLPLDHPAHAAYRAGVDTISLTRLIDGRADIARDLVRAYMAGLQRAWERAARSTH